MKKEEFDDLKKGDVDSFLLGKTVKGVVERMENYV